MMSDKLKIVDQLVTATLLTIAISLFWGVSSKGKSSASMESSQSTASSGQIISQVIRDRQ
jgi:hypothetical protein